MSKSSAQLQNRDEFSTENDSLINENFLHHEYKTSSNEHK